MVSVSERRCIVGLVIGLPSSTSGSGTRPSCDGTTRIAAAAYALGIALCSLIHVFNPDIVVVGGGVAKQGDIFLEPVRQRVSEFGVQSFAKTPIKHAKLGNSAGVVGAAGLWWS